MVVQQEVGISPGKISLVWMISLLLTGGLSLPAWGATNVDPFYLQLMRDGIRAFGNQSYGEAARLLRLACFGFLEDPPTLAQGLGHLALAQAAVRDEEGAGHTLNRLVELEDRFSAFTEAEIEPQIRLRVQELLPRYVNHPSLEASDTFRHLLSPAAAPEPPLGGAVEPAAPTLSSQAEQQMGKARSLLGKARTARDLEEPLALARKVADTHPRSSEAQHLTAEIAYRARRWQEAAEYFRRGGDPGEDRPTLLFFMAVSLYEAGLQSDSVPYLERALPRLERTAYVDDYAMKILGSKTP